MVGPLLIAFEKNAEVMTNAHLEALLAALLALLAGVPHDAVARSGAVGGGRADAGRLRQRG
jgi:hypothetical protein